MKGQFQKCGIIGGGSWGTALASTVCKAGRDVILLSRRPEVVEDIQKNHRNSLYLPHIDLDGSLKATSNPEDLADSDILFLAVPAQKMRSASLELAPYFRKDRQVLICCAKGLEVGSGLFMDEVLTQTCPGSKVAILSGPGFASDLARGLPAAVTLACIETDLGRQLCRALSSPFFRIYFSADSIGTQIGGALKNVLAIACGIVEGRALGESARAALMTRGFAEMMRLGVAMGASPETLMGLSGLGDLVLSCTSLQSRNMSLGLALGRGRALEEILAEGAGLREGFYTVQVVMKLARFWAVDMPVVEAVEAVLARKYSVEEAISRLLSRPLKDEFCPA